LECGTDRLGIIRIILLPANEWLNVLRRYDFHDMSVLLKLALPVESPGAGLNSDQARLQVTNQPHEAIAAHSSSENAPSLSVNPMQLEHIFSKIDTKSMNLQELSPENSSKNG
jgi:hypothetical protein